MKTLITIFLLAFLPVALTAQCTTNVALGTVATASTSAGTNYPGHAIDGNGTTRWESIAADPQNLDVDLGAQYNICKVVIKWEGASGKDFTIQVSNDGASWAVVGTITGNATLTNTFNLTTTGRYVRMAGTTRTTGYGYSIYEFEVYGVPTSGTTCPATNLAGGHTGMASSVGNIGNSVANAFDNSLSTRWESLATDAQWIYVDLGALYDVCKVTLNWEAAYGKDFAIQFSNNAVAWTTVRSITNNTSLLNNIPVTGTTRYVRMLGSARGTTYGYSLYEFQAFGSLNVLPVKLETFVATAANGSIRLDWSTRNEIASSHYELERSSAGNGEFEKISFIRSMAGSNSGNNYSWTDLSPAAGENFYRLKQVDIDGKFSYSTIVHANAGIGGSGRILVLYDQGNELIVFRNVSPNATVQLYDVSGNILFSARNPVTGITLSGKPHGIYVVRIIDGITQVTTRVVR